jgi:PD-(D/E)XK nuclease superfamily
VSVAHAIPTIRRSLAEGLASCPSFVMERSERLAFGQAFHRFAAAYWRHLQAIGEETDMTGWRPLAQDAWARTPGLRQSRFAEYIGLAEKFVDTHVGELATLSEAEEPIPLNVGDMVLVCTPDRIDRLDGGDRDEDATWERITDYKTELGEMDHEFQLFWYVQMRFLTQPALERVDAVLDLVRRGWPHDPITIERGALDSWWATTLDGLRHRLAIGPGPRDGGTQCDSCALRRTCGEALTVAVAIPETDEEADALLAEHHRAKAAADARWHALETYYDGRDERVVGDEEIGYLAARKPSFRIAVGSRELVHWAFRHGMDGFSLVTPTRITNRGLQDQLQVAGLGAPALGEPEFKTRKALAGTRVRRRPAGDEEDVT